MIAQQREQGFALVAAIFLLVVIALAAAIIANLTGVERSSTDLALLQARAYQSARAGAEWGISQAINLGSCVAGPTTFSLNEGSLTGFDVNVSCSTSQHQEKGLTFNVYRIQSSATFGSIGDVDYVSRSVEATVTNAS